MHTSMEAGPMIKKGEMKASTWINAYENNNVDIGLECGFSGVAQIGKECGQCQIRWRNVESKISHLEAGAIAHGFLLQLPRPSCLHYHKINIFEKHAELEKDRRQIE